MTYLLDVHKLSVKFFTREGIVNAVNNINFSINKGETVGIVGESGSGKSTLINLMLGLLHPLSGQIFVNKRNLEKTNKNWLKIISYVPQNIYIADANIFKNVGFGKKIFEINKQKVISILKKLNIYKDIKLKGLNKNQSILDKKNIINF